MQVLMLCGATAVGKSTVGYHFFTRVQAAGKAAYVDLAQVGFCAPAPAGDPAQHRLKARNVAAMLPGFRDAGARRLVVTGQVNDSAAIRVYTEALAGSRVTVCRLHAGAATLAERVMRRGRNEGPAIPGDPLRGMPAEGLHRVAEQAAREAERMHRERVGDVFVDTDGRSVAEVAELIALSVPAFDAVEQAT